MSGAPKQALMGLAAGLGAPIAGLVVAGGGFASLWLGGALVAAAVGIYTLRSAQARPALAEARDGWEPVPPPRLSLAFSGA